MTVDFAAMRTRYEVHDHVAVVTLNRPEVLNAVDPQTFYELDHIWADVRDNPNVRVAVLTGAGERAFCAGADLKRSVTRQTEPHVFWLTQRRQLLETGKEIWKPVIAAVNGYCLGAGVTLLLATDIRIASQEAVFGLPEVQRGLVATEGATWRTPRQVPWAVAMELLLIGDRVDARRAWEIGLVSRLVPHDRVLDEALALARRLAAGDTLAQQAAKELVLRSDGLPLTTGMRYEDTMRRVLGSIRESGRV